MEPDPIFDPDVDPQVKEQILARHRSTQMALDQTRHDAVAFFGRASIEDLTALRAVILACTESGVAGYWLGFVNATLASKGMCPVCDASHAPLDPHQETPVVDGGAAHLPPGVAFVLPPLPDDFDLRAFLFGEQKPLELEVEPEPKDEQ